MSGGGVNMRKAQTYIKKHRKLKQLHWVGGGGVVSQLGVFTPPHPLGGGGKNITDYVLT